MHQLNRSLKSTINLGNSIIGVSILAMPLCFKQCGILLSFTIIGLSAILNLFSCYLLLKSAIINRRRNYELLAYDVFGSGGKTLVEIFILLYLLGTCIAFFVIVGDIAPSLVAHILAIDNGPHLRALVVTILAMFVIFPLGLMRNVDNLTSFSMMSLLVYLFLALRMISLAFDKFFIPTSVNILAEVNYWNFSNVISYLPIFSMALSCQGQIFEIFHPDLFQADLRSLKYMMRSTKRAIVLTAMVYSLIGLFGYFAFYDVVLAGNILQNLPSGFLTKITLLFFLITLLTSFPLCLFPCRTSLHSLLFRKGGYSDLLSTAHSVHMSDHHFRLLTMVLIVTTMGISVIFPHVELVLALVGSTIGTVICFIVPALIFIKLCERNTVEYIASYFLVAFGVGILIFCTISTLQNISASRDVEIEEKIAEIKQKSTVGIVLPPKVVAVDDAKAIEKKTPPLAHPKLPVVVTTEFKSHINNMSKLKQSIKLDMTKLQKQEEILKKLEKQQQEHSKMLKEQREIINELKSHDVAFHEPGTNGSKDSLPANVSIHLKISSPTLPVIPKDPNVPVSNQVKSPSDLPHQLPVIPAKSEAVILSPNISIAENAPDSAPRTKKEIPQVKSIPLIQPVAPSVSVISSNVASQPKAANGSADISQSEVRKAPTKDVHSPEGAIGKNATEQIVAVPKKLDM